MMTPVDCLAQLDALLIADTRNETPPWASQAIALVPQCGDAALSWLREKVAAKDTRSFLALEALRTHAPPVYESIPAEERAETYARQLASAHWYNTWGIPEDLSGTSRALIALGKAAVPFLAPLFDSDRRAPSFGSEAATMSRLRDYRVRDYARALLAEIK